MDGFRVRDATAEDELNVDVSERVDVQSEVPSEDSQPLDKRGLAAIGVVFMCTFQQPGN
ncbi:hypothetical protein [Arthrobacter sp. efr-133-TYG-120]|uniref:hypothetical protein n=1 Tax=Arthrobacter sp. efr-133-TYG-120 TaxID=3040280 RepID=UPI00254A2AC7|nr:hypothetical protein [Arthrobacter sp. efr-133-TYG-120]